MSERRARALRRLTRVAWCALLLSIACWPAGGIGWVTTALALIPLLLPLPGIVRGCHRTLRWAPLTLAPALALALTEELANPAARLPAGLALAAILVAFAALLAALRARSRE